MMIKVLFLLLCGCVQYERCFGEEIDTVTNLTTQEQGKFLYPEDSLELDAVVCRVISRDGILAVYLSDIWLPSALGAKIELEERIIRMIWIAQGAERGVKLQNDGSSQEYAEEYLDMMQKQRGVSRDELKRMCLASGFTLNDIKKELNQQFLLQQSIETILMTTGCLNVSAEEIECYYNENPLFKPAEFTVKIMQCGESNEHNHISLSEIQNSASKVLLANNLSDDLKCIQDMHVGESCYYTDDQNVCWGVYLVHKKSEKLITLSERYEAIMRTLQQKKYRKHYKEFTIQFLSDGDTVFFNNEKLRQQCINFVCQQVASADD